MFSITVFHKNEFERFRNREIKTVMMSYYFKLFRLCSWLLKSVWSCGLKTSLLISCSFVLMFYFPVNNFTVMLEYFLGWISTKLRIKCLVQGHTTGVPVSLEPATSRSQVKTSTTEPLRSSVWLDLFRLWPSVRLPTRGIQYWPVHWR